MAMWPTLTLLLLGAIVPDGTASDPDQTAELLGLSNPEAQSLSDDAKAFMPPKDVAAETTHSSGWAALLPDVTVGYRYQTACNLRDTSGAFVAQLPESTVLLVSATWPLPDAGRGSPRQRRWLAQAETLPRPAPAAPPPPDPTGPTIQELQQAAEDAALLHPADLASLRSRARGSAWLPELSAEYQRNVGDIDMLGIRSGSGVDTSALEDVSRYGVRATWRLSELVFSPQELQVAASALKLQAARRELLAEVAKVYFERKRLLLKRHLEPDADARKRLTLDIEEHSATLDALTGGYFSQHLHRRAP
ncbi:MAG: hypothetical protein ACYDCL_01710 [Myxococcales bacterium]